MAGKSVFAWNGVESQGGGYVAGGGSDNGSVRSNTLTEAQLAHLPPSLQKAYAAAMAGKRPFTTKDYHYLMMQYDLYESSQQQMQRQKQQYVQGRPSIAGQFKSNNNLYASPPGAPPLGFSNDGRYMSQHPQGASRRSHRDSNLLYGGGGGSGYSDDDIHWNYLTPAIAAGYLAVQCMDATFDGGDMSSALAAVDI